MGYLYTFRGVLNVSHESVPYVLEFRVNLHPQYNIYSMIYNSPYHSRFFTLFYYAYVLGLTCSFMGIFLSLVPDLPTFFAIGGRDMVGVGYGRQM